MRSSRGAHRQLLSVLHSFVRRDTASQRRTDFAAITRRGRHSNLNNLLGGGRLQVIIWHGRKIRLLLATRKAVTLSRENGGVALSRPGNNPKRRIAHADKANEEVKNYLELAARYVGSGHHKRNPADYGFSRASPRPTKSLCDMGRVVLINEAKLLLAEGIRRGLFSEVRQNGFPKFIWSVSEYGEVFEAKTDANGTGEYHGYPLEDEDAMHLYVKSVWEERCRIAGQ